MNTTAGGNADALSRSPLSVVPANVQDSPVTAGQFVLGHRKIQFYQRWYNFSSKADLVMGNLSQLLFFFFFFFKSKKERAITV